MGRGKQHCMGGRAVLSLSLPQALSTPPSKPPPTTPGAELGSQFSPQGSRMTSNQGSQALSIPFLRVGGLVGSYFPKGAGIGQNQGVPVGSLELGLGSHGLK